MNKSYSQKNKGFLSQSILVFAFFVLVSFVLFGNGISGDFVFDDHFVITGNPLVETKANIFKIFSNSYHYKQPESGLYRPFTLFSYALNEAIFGKSPVSFHVTNIFLHAFVSFLLFRLLLFFVEQRIAFISALLFMFLPVHVEAVTSIIGRAEILATLFVILAILKAFRGHLYWSLFYFFIALLSKETAVAFLPIWVFILYRYKNLNVRLIMKELWPYGAVLAGYFGLRYIALGPYILSAETQFAYNPLKYLPFSESIGTALKVTWMYISKMLVPLSFSSDYSYNQIPAVKNIFSSWQSLTGLSILAALLWALYRYRLAGFAAMLFLAPFFIVSNFVFKTGTIMAERLMYMPSVGGVLLMAIFVEYVIARGDTMKKISFGALAVLLSFYTYQIIDRNKDWLTEDSLFASAYESAPESIVNKTNRAYLYMKNNDLAQAKKQIDEVLAIRPEHLGALHLAGRISQLQGDANGAYQFWSRALEIKPNYFRAIMNIGQIEYERGEYEKAETTLARAIEFNARWNEVFLLAMTKTKLGKYDEAITLVSKLFGDNPENNNLKFALGLAYYRKGDMQKAQFYFDQSRNPEVSKEDFIKALESL